MRTLILTCNTGEGHNSCARAIEEYYRKQGADCRVEDGLQFVSFAFSGFISRGHSFVYRYLPWLFRWGYHSTEKHPSVCSENAMLYKVLSAGTDRLYQYIKENEFDRIICTHLFAAMMLSDVIRKYKVQLVTGFVATDYTCYPGVKDCCLDYYFISDKSFGKEFEGGNITPEKIISSGIPVRQMFYEMQMGGITGFNLQDRHNTKKLLLMCGSMGCGPIAELLGKLTAEHRENWEIIVVCGRNERLHRKLGRKYAEEKNVHIEGYVQNMALLMEQADLYITKPGGISISEAAVKTLPMLLVDAVAGCEEYNRIYFVNNGGARTNENLKELAKTCVILMEDEKELQHMRKHLTEMYRYNASQIIFEKMQEGQRKNGQDDKME